MTMRITPTIGIGSISAIVVVLLSVEMMMMITTISAQDISPDIVYGDRWNYGETVIRPDGFTDYQPNQWGRISCDESTREGLDACLAYTDKWHEGREWAIEKNYCRDCPADDPDVCGRHHMSPINLERNRALGFWEKTEEENNGNPGEGAHPLAKECIDVHWMKYEDSWCPLDQMIEADSFTIERHALRISQPITVDEDDTLNINCIVEGKGRRFGRLDYSKGFSQWWFLSHIDIHTPSEHTQEGKRYDAELQLHHFYSEGVSTTEVNNELGTVSMFMQVYDDVPPYRDLDRVICLWRRKEYEVRKACGLEPIQEPYPGCFPLQRNLRRKTQEARSHSSGVDKKNAKKSFSNMYEFLLAKEHNDRQIQSGKNVTQLPRLNMGEENWAPPERSDGEWAAFIEEQSARFREEDELWKALHREFNDTAKAHEQFHARRNLIEGEEIEWFNYWPMLGVRTEYYYRYSGSMTTPPCYGNAEQQSRQGTLHWRVMKDPVRIHQNQLNELKRLLRERIAPIDDPLMACQPDTAAKVNDRGDVDVARPLQSFHPAHFKVFCECKDWPSKWPEDREWCDIEDVYERFYDKPYNFESNGF